jgi:hypothetical protein
MAHVIGYSMSKISCRIRRIGFRTVTISFRMSMIGSWMNKMLWLDEQKRQDILHYEQDMINEDMQEDRQDMLQNSL